MLYILKEHFWVVINVLRISKDAIYNNKSEISTGSFRSDFFLLRMFHTELFLPTSASYSVRERWAVSHVYTHGKGHPHPQRQLEAFWDMLHIPSYNESMDTRFTGDTFMQMPKFNYLKLKLLSLITSYGAMGYQGPDKGEQRSQLNCFVVSSDFFLSHVLFYTAILNSVN